MPDLMYRTAGESHGRALTVFVEGLPAGLTIDVDLINAELRRRQGGYGRGARQKIETDEVQVLSGVRRGRTIGAPLVMQIANRDFRIDDAPEVNRPRPGHADLPGSARDGGAGGCGSSGQVPAARVWDHVRGVCDGNRPGPRACGRGRAA